MSTSVNIKNFSTFLGLDLAASDLVRRQGYSSGALNDDINRTGALVKRNGYQYITGSTGGFGSGIWKNINITTGALTEVPVTVDNSLYTLIDDSFTITYSGSNTSLLTIAVDPTTSLFTLTISENGTAVLTQNLKVGMKEASHTTVADVKTAINAVANYTASGGTVTTGPAPFLNLQNQTALTASATTIGYKRWSTVNNSKATPLSVTQTHRDDTDFENASFANLNGCLYVATGYDFLMKYDGQTFYRAGMPAPATITTGNVADSGSGNTHTSGDAFVYFATYQQKDAKGNLIEGYFSNWMSAAHTMGATKDVLVTIAGIQASTGFNTNCAIVNGGQSTVSTITVTAGHTLNVSDTAYFYDSVSASYVERNINAKTATTISVDGAAVTVAASAVISNNLRINLYRTVKNPVTLQTASYFLVNSFPNDSINATQVLTDNVTDALLGAQWIPPVKAHQLPPSGRYITTYRNQLFIGGVPTSVNSLYYSDINNPEYFPAGDNSILVDAFAGNKIRGVGALDSAVIIFKDVSIQSVTGDIGQDNFRVDEISYGGIGTTAHASIQPVSGALYFLSRSGIYSVSLGSSGSISGNVSVARYGVNNAGMRIQPEFTKIGVLYNFQKAVGVTWAKENKYLLFVPAETLDGSSHYYANTNSATYVYDYKWDAWHKWDTINAQGGWSYKTATGDLYFQSRRLDSNSTATEFQTAHINNYGNLNDYTDHELVTSFSYATNWMDMGDPGVFKKFLRLRVFALDSDVLSGDISLYQLGVQQEINFATPAPIATWSMDFSGGTNGYDSAGWDGFPWGDSPLPSIRSKIKGSKTRVMRLIFTNATALQGVLVSGYEIEATAPYQVHLKE